ncbi:MAG TPA: hypothetical protein VHJ18_12535 [Streptosporangiaceae bacterium]|nr:hypothetical protein [Streptosporangiaceae bacterium]
MTNSTLHEAFVTGVDTCASPPFPVMPAKVTRVSPAESWVTKTWPPVELYVVVGSLPGSQRR